MPWDAHEDAKIT